MPVFSAFPRDLGAIFAFHQLGCSVIPLIGGADIQIGKRPALSWSVYQKRHPSPTELQQWFAADRSAYGVICGRVSRLVVLDLDDSDLALRFMQHFPHLLNTLIVRSGVRSTPHIYWRVDFAVRSRPFPGGDLKGDGGYVVGPGSSMGDHTWDVLSDHPPRDLSLEEFESVLAFLNISPVRGAQPQIQDESLTSPAEVDFVNLYHYFCDQYQSRNQALFRVACLMRDRGLAAQLVINLFGQLYADQVMGREARHESYSSRYAEALGTINSVFSRRARSQPVVTQTDVDEPVSRLPNSVREALLSRPDGIAAARLLDAVRIVGLSEDKLLTEAQICFALKGIICRESIRKALAFSLEDGTALFSLFPPENPPAEADTNVGKARQKNAFLSGGQKQTKRFYRFSSVLELCEKLAVAVTGGDALGLADVNNARRYRQALHQALLQRRPGYYSQKLLARRVNVSTRTIRRYNLQLGVHTQPSYQETPVMWSNLMQIPTGADIQRHCIRTGGKFLLDDTGKRWPLKREIAEYLLKQKRRISQIQQGVNYYWFGAVDAHQTPADLPNASTIQPVALPTPPIWSAPDKNPVAHIHVECPRNAPEAACMRSNTDSRIVRQEKPQKPRSKRYFQNALPDTEAEQLAQQVTRVTGNMSVANARRLVDTFGYQPVAVTVRKLAWLKQHMGVENPAGFMVTAARVSWRSQQQANGTGESVPMFTAEPQRRERAAAYVPPQADPLRQSVVYQEWRSAFLGLDDHLPLVVEAELPY